VIKYKQKYEYNMKKIFLYTMLACMTLAFGSCSDDPMDATEKHVYGENESPYLRTDASATIAYTAEFRKGHVEAKTISLNDYAETIKSKLGMTVDELMAAVESGKVVFYNINTARGKWDKTAPTKGTLGWYYDASGLICGQDSQVASIELDKEKKSLVVDVPVNSEAGVSLSANVGFAINNGKDYDDYVRFNFTIMVSDPSLIMANVTIPEGDYNTYSVKYSDYENAIASCLGLTVKQLNDAVAKQENDIALYMYNADGTWNTTAEYNTDAGVIGFWCTKDGTVQNWGDGCQYFVQAVDGSLNIGRYPGVASGTTNKVHCVLASKKDPSKYVEFVVNLTFA